MKRLLRVFLAVTVCAAMFVGCAPKTEATTEPAQNSTETTTAEAPATPTAMEGEISVVSREDGSGTRGAFIELLGIEEKNEAGEKVDNTTEEASITNTTAVMMTTVSGDKAAIGYISLGSLNDTIKALKVDGVAPSVATIKDGTYKVSRPFNIVKSAKATEVAQDFIDFILSDEGQKIVEDAGYISKESTGAFTGGKVSGKIVVAGSSSVVPAMEKLKEAYAVVNPNVEIEVQQSDSTTGMNSAIDGICDIGMASRELKDSEIEAGLTPVVIAVDGIAVIVNNENTMDELSSDSIKSIFKGEVMDWAEVK